MPEEDEEWAALAALAPEEDEEWAALAALASPRRTDSGSIESVVLPPHGGAVGAAARAAWAARAVLRADRL